MNSSLQYTQWGGGILQNREKPQKTLNHKNPKSHTSFSSLPGQPLTAPVKKYSERTGAAGRLLFPAHKGRPPPRFTFKPHFQSSSPSRRSLGKQNHHRTPSSLALCQDKPDQPPLTNQPPHRSPSSFPFPSNNTELLPFDFLLPHSSRQQTQLLHNREQPRSGSFLPRSTTNSNEEAAPTEPSAPSTPSAAAAPTDAVPSSSARVARLLQPAMMGRSPCSSACLLRLLLHRRRPTWPDLQPAENNEAEKKAKPRTKQTQNGNKQIREPERKKLKPTALRIFGLLQVTVTLTVGAGRQRRGRGSRSTGFCHLHRRRRRVGQRAATVPVVPEGFLTLFWDVLGLFCSFNSV